MLSAILLVDDDPTTNFLNQRLLRQLNASHEVLVALNGQQALALLEAHCRTADADAAPTLVLLDVSMPVMDGFEFLESFANRSPARQRGIVVVMLSSSQLHQDLVRAQDLPVAAFLQKPLTHEKMTDVLVRLMGCAPTREGAMK